jgi:hypothetical protein
VGVHVSATHLALIALGLAIMAFAVAKYDHDSKGDGQ